MKMRVTERDKQMLAKLGVARWLTTQQVRLSCFPDVSVEMARRRLRVLRQAGYVFTHQANQMAESLHTLGPEGRKLLFRYGYQDNIRLERKPPKNLEHFLGINDIRIAVERSAQREGLTLSFFFSCWELARQHWDYSIIPDAVCQFEWQGGEALFLYEMDCNTESPSYMARAKFQPYGHGLQGLSIKRIIVVAGTTARLRQLQKYCDQVTDTAQFAFLSQDDLRCSFSLREHLP